MSYQEKRHIHLFLQPFQKLQNSGLNGYINSSSRLIRDQKVGIICKGHCNHHALPLAPGKLMGIGIQTLRCLRQPDKVEELQDPPVCIYTGHTLMKHETLTNLSFYGVKRIQGSHRLLEDHRNSITTHLLQGLFLHSHDLAAFKKNTSGGVYNTPAGVKLHY